MQCVLIHQDFRFPSFSHQRESSKPLKKLDARFREYAELTDLAEVLFTIIIYRAFAKLLNSRCS
jgi:hypothetical protein